MKNTEFNQKTLDMAISTEESLMTLLGIIGDLDLEISDIKAL